MPNNRELELPANKRRGILSQELGSLLRAGLIAILISLLGIAAFSIISFVGAPFAVTVLINAWFTGSAIYLSAISYGIINDIIGCHKNLPYFMLGHQPGQRGVIKSNNPNTVGIYNNTSRCSF